jgi:hypothetical protein
MMYKERLTVLYLFYVTIIFLAYFLTINRLNLYNQINQYISKLITQSISYTLMTINSVLGD